jgi:hypothetical protein
MNAPITPESLLHQMAQIRRMDRGTIHILRQGPQGPYYNHQCYERGKNVSRYLSAAQVSDLSEALQGYQRYQQLNAQYVELIVARTRAERTAGSKKKTPRPPSSWRRTRKSTA